jgi:hypothetical protein
MNDDHSYPTLGVAVDEILAAATFDWCKHHRHGRPNEEAFAEAIQGVEMSLLMMPRGRINVTMTVSGYNGRNAEVNFWRLRRGPRSRLTLVGSSLNL